MASIYSDFFCSTAGTKMVDQLPYFAVAQKLEVENGDFVRRQAEYEKQVVSLRATLRQVQGQVKVCLCSSTETSLPPQAWQGCSSTPEKMHLCRRSPALQGAACLEPRCASASTLAQLVFGKLLLLNALSCDHAQLSYCGAYSVLSQHFPLAKRLGCYGSTMTVSER